MELKEAIELLKTVRGNEYVATTDYESALNIVLEALEISQAKQEVAFEQGYRKGKDKGQQEGLQCGYGMGMQVKLRGEENGTKRSNRVFERLC